MGDGETHAHTHTYIASSYSYCRARSATANASSRSRAIGQAVGDAALKTIRKNPAWPMYIDMPGVIAIFHHDNFPKLHRSPASFPEENVVDELRTPFEDDEVHYAGQFVALVVADTFEQARDAAYRVKVSYDAASAAANLAQGRQAGETEANRTERGDADSAYASAEVKIDATYTTPVETHNPMEMHATTARIALPR